MSTKFDALLKTSREALETAKNTFLDALADFLNSNKNSVFKGNHFSFSIRIHEADTDKSGYPKYNVSFGTYSTPSAMLEADFTTTYASTILTYGAIEKFLHTEYNAEVSVIRSRGVFTYLKCNLPVD